MELSLGIISQIIVGEDELVIVFIGPDAYHGVVVHSAVIMFISPLSAFGFPRSYWLAVFFYSIIRVVIELESVVVDGSSFDDTEELCLTEGLEFHRTGVFINVLVVHLEDLVGLEVDDVNFLFRNIQDNDFLVVDLAEEVDAVGIGSFVENFSIFIKVDDALIFSRFVHAHAYEGVFEGDGDAEDLRPDGVELDGGSIFEPHEK